MIYLTQLVYVHPGQEDAFNAFESVVIPLIAKHGGELMLRVRPPAASIIEGSSEAPYEIHLVRFPSEEQLASFSKDPQRQEVIHLKDAAVRKVVLLKATEP